ncbi:MAG TPA: hypothetical protein VMF31_06345 [Solirubrobacterales bacterium]|nr:hypothetical protein [Solirubrobacterales bacterium]
MRRNDLKRIALGTAATLAVAGILAGCGGEDDPASSKPTPPAAQSEPVKPRGATGPASANDERPAAPDDKISERPGGPEDKRGKAEKPRKRAGVSGGISPAPASP